MKNYADIIIIGAGPIGLYFASKCEKSELDYLLLEATSEVGGQITHLYPEKEIVDIPGIPSIKSKDYIELISKQVNKERIVFSTKVNDIQEGEQILLLTSSGNFSCKKLVVVTGLGSSTPRPLGVEHENDVKNIIYNLTDFSFLTNKRVAIFGGGDSALDWAKQLSSISKDVHLVHRRTEFRGNPETIKNCKDLKLHLPYVPKCIEVDGETAKSITIQKVESDEEIVIPVDYIFVNYGNVAKQSSFHFQMTGAFLNVNDNLEITKNIYAIGDVACYQNKTRRIAPGNLEADKVFKEING